MEFYPNAASAASEAVPEDGSSKSGFDSDDDPAFEEVSFCDSGCREDGSADVSDSDEESSDEAFCDEVGSAWWPDEIKKATVLTVNAATTAIRIIINI